MTAMKIISLNLAALAAAAGLWAAFKWYTASQTKAPRQLPPYDQDEIEVTRAVLASVDEAVCPTASNCMARVSLAVPRGNADGGAGQTFRGEICDKHSSIKIVSVPGT